MVFVAAMLCKPGLYSLPDFARTVWKNSSNNIPIKYPNNDRSIIKFTKNLSIWMVPILLITRTLNLVFYVYPFITQTPTDYYKIRRFFGTSFKNWCLKTYEFREQKYSREKGGRVVKAERIERKVRSIVEGKDRYIDR